MELVWPAWTTSPAHAWTLAYATALVGAPLDFWYDLLFFKPPLVGGRTEWHQDAAYLERDDTPDFLITTWLALEDIDEDAGLMTYASGLHRDGPIAALRSDDGYYGSDAWTPEHTERVIAPAGTMLFHHGFAPHRADANRSERWRLALLQRFVLRGVPLPQGHEERR